MVAVNSFNTSPPGRGGSWQPVASIYRNYNLRSFSIDESTLGNQLLYGPPRAGGVTLGFRFGISNDKLLQFAACFRKITILDILSRNIITYALDVFLLETFHVSKTLRMRLNKLISL